jgi:UDP-N-acetylglucosamine acyltransferase
MTRVHATAVIESGAELGQDVEIGPGAVVGPHCQIGARTRIGAHAVIEGHTQIGADCRIYPHAVLGTPPQDIKYAEEPTRLVLGERNLIREFVTIHRGTPQGNAVTTIGSDVFLMAYCHVAHDNLIADHVIVANNSQLAGHVQLGEHAIVGGVSAVHQFVRVGPSAFVGGGSVVVMDVPPFCKATGNRARLHGINAIGLKRRGFSNRDLQEVRKAYRLAFHSNLLVAEAVARIRQELLPACPALEQFAAFLESSQRGVTR